MSQTTPDIRQLSTCCGELLPWNQNNPGGWMAVCPRCEEQRFWSRPADGRPFRKLTATEELLLARIAELEAAQRWRVTAEELPPVGEWVIGWWPVGSIPCDVVSFDGAFWNAAGAHGIRPPDQWQPIVSVASGAK